MSRWTLTAVAFVSALMGGLLVRLLAPPAAEGWKPTGDGRTVVNTETGEIKPTAPDMAQIEGRWVSDLAEDKESGWRPVAIVFTPRSMSYDGNGGGTIDSTWFCKVLEAGPSHYVIEREHQGMNGQRYVNVDRIDFTKESLTHQGRVYRRDDD